MANLCKQCNTDLDEAVEEADCESLEEKMELIQDCTKHEPNFDPDDYKTWPEGYQGMMTDRAHDAYKDSQTS